MLDALKIAVVGTGAWGKNHVRVFSEMLNVEIVAVCDLDLERARSTASRYGVKNYYRDVEEVLRKHDLDAVSICTPSISHAEIARKCLEAGLHVFVEKPLASTLDECLTIIETAKSQGKWVMTGFIERFNPATRKAKNMLECGEIGEAIMGHGRRIGWWPERIGDVGVVKDTAIHDIDLARYFFNSDPDTVYAKGGRYRHKAAEDHVQAILSFNDKTVFIEANWLTPRKKRELYITGSDGVMSIHFLTQQIILEKSDIIVEPIMKYEEPLKNELSYFVESILEKRKPYPDEIDGAKAIAIAEAIIESMEKNKVVEPKTNEIH